MKIPLKEYSGHLSYCMNVHPGNHWQDHFAALKNFVPKVKAQVLSSKAPFGLGLRLSAEAVATLLKAPEEIQALQAFCQQENLYPYTINVFPYGEFHHGAVKESVYQPGWETPERLQYTLQAAQILAGILPADLEYGSLSTVALGYRALLKPENMPAIFSNLNSLIIQLEQLERTTGRLVRVGLEPEPDCLLDSCDSICEFFTEQLRKDCLLPLDVQNRYLGVCLDTCHQAVLYESSTECLKTLRQADIPIVKVHISAAPIFSGQHLKPAEAFIDPVYLHQSSVRIPSEAPVIHRFSDLPQALDFAKDHPEGELRTHFHIPLACPDSAELRSSRNELDPEFVRELQLSGVRHLEVETYTFAVLPAHLRQSPLEISIAEDLLFCRNLLKQM